MVAKRSHVYKITNIKNNKSYIGVTGKVKPIHRWKKHILISKNKELYLKNGSFKSLHQAIVDDGVSSFIFEILEQCIPSLGFKREKYWIKFYNTFGDNGYNRTAGGKGFNGRKHSKETKEKLSVLNKGKISGEKHPMFGRKHSQETKDKISAIKKIRFNRGKNNPFFGKKHSKDTIEIIKSKAKDRLFEKEWVIKRIKLTSENVDEIKKLYDEDVKVSDLAEKFKVSIPCIYKVIKKPRKIDQ